MRRFQAPLDTCLDNPLLCQPLNSRFALHGLRLRAFESEQNCRKHRVRTSPGQIFGHAVGLGR